VFAAQNLAILILFLSVDCTKYGQRNKKEYHCQPEHNKAMKNDTDKYLAA